MLENSTLSQQLMKHNSLFGELTPNTGADGKPLEDPINPPTLPEDEFPEEEEEPTPPSTNAPLTDTDQAGKVPKEEGVQQDPPTQEEEDTFSYLDVAEGLGDLFIPDPDKEYEDSEEGFKELQQDTITALFEQKYGLEDGEHLAYLAFIKQGGTNREWLEQTTLSYADADLEDEDTQKVLLTKQFELQGLKPEAITKKLERLEKAGTLEEEAKDAQEYLVEQEAKAAKDFQAQVLKQEELQKEAATKQLVTLQADIEGSEALSGIPLTPGLKKSLYAHITKPVGPKGETQWQLNQRDKGKVLSAALLDMLGVDSEDLTRKEVTKQATKLQTTLKTLSRGDKTGGGQTVKTATPTGNKIPTKGMPWSS